MANAFSIPRRQSKYIPTLNIKDIERTMAVKQNNYDYNTAQVGQAIAQFSSVDLIRDKDKAHLMGNLSKVLGIVDNTDNIDFTKTGVGQELSTYISKAIDGEVLKQATNTLQIRKYNSKLAKLKEDNPELYSAQNDRDARMMSNYYEYIDGDKDTLGALNYNPFVDVQGGLLKKMKELKDLYPNKSVKIPTGDGYFVEKKVSGLTQEEWKTVLPTMLTEKDRGQLAINGRVRFEYNDEAALKSIESIKTHNNESLEESLKKLDSKMLDADDATKKELEEQKALIKNRTTKMNTLLDTKGTTAGSIGGFQLENELVNSLANTFGAQEEVEYSVDNTYWKRIEQEAEAQKALLTSNVGSGEVFTTADTQDLDNIGNLLQQKEQKHEENVSSLKNNLAKIYNSFDAQTQSMVDQVEQEELRKHQKHMEKDPSLKPLTEMQLHRKVIEKVSLGDNSVLTLPQIVELKSQIDEIDSFNKAKVEAFKSAEDNIFYKNSEEIYEELTSNKKIKMFDGKGGETTFNNFLKENGINSESDLMTFLSSDSEKAKTFKANFLVQNINNLFAVGKMMSTSDFLIDMASWDPVKMGERSRPMNSLPKDTLRKIERAKNLLGESKELGEIFTFSDNNGEISYDQVLNGAQVLHIDVKDKDSKIGNMLLNSALSSRVLLSEDWLLRDTSLGQEGGINSKFSEKEFTREYEASLNLSTATMAGQNTITINAPITPKQTTPIFREVLTKMQAYSPDGAGLDRRLPISIRKTDSNTYSMFQYQDDEDRPVIVGSFTTRELQSMPNLANEIDLLENKEAIQFNSEIRKEVPKLNYMGTTAKNQQGLKTVYDPTTAQGRAKILMSSKDGVMEYLRQSPQLRRIDETEKGSQYLQMVKKATQNPNKFSLKIDQHGQEGALQVLLDIGGGKKQVVESINISNQLDQKGFRDSLYATPQLFLTLALENIGKEYITTGDSENIDLINSYLK